MAEAPHPRSFGSMLGKSMGVAVEGIQPEIARNRQHPDGTDRSGQPWPDADEPTLESFGDSDTFSGISTGGATYVAEFTLPAPGIWIVIGSGGVTFAAPADASDHRCAVTTGLSYSTGGSFADATGDVFVGGIGSTTRALPPPFGLGNFNDATGLSFRFDIATSMDGSSTTFSGTVAATAYWLRPAID